MTAPTEELPERVETANGIEFAWSATDRVARMQFLRPDSFGTREDALELTEALRRWADSGPGPFAMLVDAEQTETVDADYRAVFFAFCDRERHRLFAAWFDARPHVLAIIRMFITAVSASGPFHGAYFDTEPEARDWLRERGVGRG